MYNSIFIFYKFSCRTHISDSVHYTDLLIMMMMIIIVIIIIKIIIIMMMMMMIIIITTATIIIIMIILMHREIKAYLQHVEGILARF